MNIHKPIDILLKVLSMQKLNNIKMLFFPKKNVGKIVLKNLLVLVCSTNNEA